MPVPLIVAGTAACGACCVALQDCGADENGVAEPSSENSAPQEKADTKVAESKSCHISESLLDAKMALTTLPAGIPSHVGDRSPSIVSATPALSSSGCKSSFRHPQQRSSDHDAEPTSKKERLQIKLRRILSYNNAESSKVRGEADKSPAAATPSSGFVNGIFTEGRVRNIVPPSECFVIKFNPASSLLAVGLKRGEGVVIYETKYFSVVHVIEQDDTVSAIDWVTLPTTSGKAINANDAHSCLLAVGSFDGIVSVYNVNSKLIEIEGTSTTLLRSARLESEIRGLRFMKGMSASSSEIPFQLAIGEKNGQLSFLSIGCIGGNGDASELRCVDREQSSVLSIQFSPDMKWMATGSKEGKIKVSMLQESNGSITVGHRLFEIQRNGSVQCLAFSQDSSRLFAGGYDKSMVVIDTQVWNIVREIEVEGTIQSMEYDPLSRYLAVGSRAKTLTLYDTSTLRPVKELQYAGWVTSVSWGSDKLEDIIAVRCGSKLITLINIKPIHLLSTEMKSARNEGSALSWSYDGQFLARANGNEVAVADATSSFTDVAKAARSGTVRCVRFCHCLGKYDLIAAVGLDGYLTVYKLCNIVGQLSLEIVCSSFVEKNLWVVAWSRDGTYLACGGREKTLRFISASDLKERCPPLKLEGRVWAIDFMPNGCSDMGLAVGTGDYLATIYDITEQSIPSTPTQPTPTLQIARPRTVRCLCYHPDLPILALGDGGNNVAIIDLIEEETILEFSVGGRVHSLDFSRCGGFLAVAADDSRFTIHETASFRAVQEISTKGLATAVAFSGVNGQHLALGSENGDVKVVHLGPFLSTQFIPLRDGIDGLPGWSLNEALYRSGQGPSLIQRFMRDGSGDSLKQAALIVEKYPDSIFTFDRTNGEDCYDTALALRRPNLLKALLLQVVKGTRETERGTESSFFMAEITQIGVDILLDMLAHYPPDFVVEILSNMTFIKVPFTEPRTCSPSDNHNCGSSSYTDPWGAPSDPRQAMKRSDKAYVLNEGKEKGIVRTPAVLPLQGLGSVKFLTALIKSAPPDAFDNDAMGIVLRVMWYKHVRWYFLVDITVFIIFYILWILYINWSATSTYHNSPLYRHEWAAILVTTLILTFNTLFGVKELAESDWGRNRKHLLSWWNMIDLVATVLVYAYAMTTGINGIGSGSVPLGVATTFFLTLKLLAYLRGFGETGWLISVLTANFRDIRGFVLVLFSILVGFTGVFRLLFGDVAGTCTLALDVSDEVVEDCDREPFGTLSVSLLSTFELAVMGAYDSALFEASRYSRLAGVTFVVAVTVVLVVSLNALIAVLGDSYSRVQKHERANRRKERAELIVEYLSLMPARRKRQIESDTKYFHALLEADADGDLVVSTDDWQGGLNALKSDLSEMQRTNATVTLKAIDEMKLDIDSEINEMRREIGAVLDELSFEVKALLQMQRDGGITFANTNVAKAVKSVTTIGKNLPKLAPGQFAGQGPNRQFAGRNLFRPINRRSHLAESEHDEDQAKSERPGSPLH